VKPCAKPPWPSLTGQSISSEGGPHPHCRRRRKESLITNEEIESPLLDSGKIYATGLFAHPPSRYVYALNGKWNTLRGEAALHTARQADAAGVVFVIKTDGQETFRSAAIRGAKKASYQVDVSKVKTLELIVEKAGTRNAANWALWLDPVLSR
jgi:hypothetical protein